MQTPFIKNGIYTITGVVNKMTIQQLIEELKNIKEQATNDDEIGKNSILEAITDVIHDAGGDGLDFDMDYDDDHFGSFEETDFSSLADLDN